jgi:hypothetical protein
MNRLIRLNRVSDKHMAKKYCIAAVFLLAGLGFNVAAQDSPQTNT